MGKGMLAMFVWMVLAVIVGLMIAKKVGVAA